MNRRDDERDLLIESALTAHRVRDAAGSIQPSGAWCDLDEEGRESLFEAQVIWRWVERQLSRRGLSSTGAEVVDRVKRIGQAD